LLRNRNKRNIIFDYTWLISYNKNALDGGMEKERGTAKQIPLKKYFLKAVNFCIKN